MAKKATKSEEKAIVTAVDATFQQQDETVESRVEFEIKKFNVADAKILELKKQFEGLEIKGVEDKHGIKAVTEAISILRTMRTGVDKKHTELKAFYLNTGRGIDAEKNRIKELIAEIEDPLKAKKDAIDAEIQRIKDEEEAKEQKRLDDRVDALKEAGIVFDGSFYSIGESVSVDLLTIKDLEDEAFEKLVKMVQRENEKIQEAKRVEELHETRKEQLLPFWSFLLNELQVLKFGEMTELDFDAILHDVRLKKQKFEEQQKEQAEKEQKLIDDRKAFNYEKRAFRLEKEGFENIDGFHVFSNPISMVSVLKTTMEDQDDEQFENVFQIVLMQKKDIEEKMIQRDEIDKEEAQRKIDEESSNRKRKEDEEKIDSRIRSLTSLGLKFNFEFSSYVFHDINFHATDIQNYSDEKFNEALIAASKRKAEIEKELHDKAEAERLAKLTDLEKIERYCQELMNVAVPQLTAPETQEEIQALRDELKKAVDRTLSNIKKLK